ncbi:MAG: hypothetical protein ACQKBV_08895 [Puniceicoccales bacterium]
MSTFPRSRIRIAADLFHFDNFTDALRADISGYTPKFRAGDDVQFEIALFNDGSLLTDFSGVSSLHLEIKPLGPEDNPAYATDLEYEQELRGPGTEVTPIRSKALAASELNTTLTLPNWEDASPEHAHAIIVLSSAEANLAPGDRWLTLAVTTTGFPTQTRTIAAGPIRILGGGRYEVAST